MRYWVFLMCLFFSCTGWAMKDPNVVNLGTFGNWTAYSYTDEMGRICYIASQPTKSAGKYAKRDDVFLMVTHRPSEKAFDVVNTVAGYTYRPGSKASLSIDGKKAVLLTTHEDTAWAKDAATDTKLVEQMKDGSQGVLKGTSKRGTATTDTFSFKGFSKAYQAMSEACNR